MSAFIFDVIKNDYIVASLFLIIHTLRAKENITPLLGDINLYCIAHSPFLNEMIMD